MAQKDPQVQQNGLFRSENTVKIAVCLIIALQVNNLTNHNNSENYRKFTLVP